MKQMVMIFGGSTAVYAAIALLMGVLPGYELSQTKPTPGLEPLTPIEAEGREVYVANGCGYCHTQQVRPVPEDKIFGRPSAPGDFVYQTPELLGSERTGPDLTNIGSRQPSSVWQYIHLYNPRAVVAASVMPSFSWMFEVVPKAPKGTAPVPLPPAYAPKHGVVVPSLQAQALVAYLLSLKQPPLPSNKTEAHGAATAPAASGQVAGAGTAGARAAGAASAPAAGTAGAPAAGTASAPAAGSPAAASAAGGSGYAYDAAKGAQLFTAHCAACHQPTGQGIPGAFPALAGNAAVNDPDPGKHIRTVLYGLQGQDVGGVVYSSAMPPFAPQLDDVSIADIINYERESWGNHGAKVTAAQVAAARAAGN